MLKTNQILLISDGKKAFELDCEKNNKFLDENSMLNHTHTIEEIMEIIAGKSFDFCLANCERDSPGFLRFTKEFIDKGYDFPLILLSETSQPELEGDLRIIDRDVKNALYIKKVMQAIKLQNKQSDSIGILGPEDLKNEQTIKVRDLMLENEKLRKEKQALEFALRKEIKINRAKMQVVSAASHEFRTPLANILSSTSLILKHNDGTGNKNIKKHALRVQSCVGSLIEVLNNYLSLAKIEEGAVKNCPEATQIDSYIEELLSDNFFSLKKGQHYKYKHLKGSACVEIDKFMFKSIFLNLFSNAVKYSPEGKDIEITTKCVNNLFELKIKDQGIGISEEDQARLCERFFRAANSTGIQGTGIGLNIVKKYLELMNGTICCRSQLSKGTEFTVQIPVHSQ